MLNAVKRFVHWVCPPHVFDFWMEQFNLNIRWQSPSARVISHKIIDDQYVQLQLQPSKKFAGFKAGQHISLLGQINAMVEERCYSIANLPNQQNLMEITVKIQGKFSRWLAYNVKRKSIIEISQAFGQNQDQQNNVYIAGGIGITAIFPLVAKASLATNQDNKTTLIYLANKKSPYLFRKALEAFSNVNIVFFDGRQALSDNSFFKQYIKSTDSVFCCGSNGFNQAIKENLAPITNQISFEHFSSPMLDQNTHSSVEKKSVTIHLKRSKKTINSDNHSNILQTLMHQGIDVKKGCQQGICHQCSCKLTKGSILQQQTLLTSGESQQQFYSVQPCISTAQTDIELDL